jgi:hypothetical protein
VGVVSAAGDGRYLGCVARGGVFTALTFINEPECTLCWSSAAKEQSGVTPPASRPCAARRNKCFRLERGFLARRDIGRPSSGRCSNNDDRR